MWNDSEEEEERDKVYIEEEEIGERDERRSLMDTIFSWSIEEIVNRDLYRGEVSLYQYYLFYIERFLTFSTWNA